MDKKIIAVIAVVIVAVIAIGLFVIGSSYVTLEALDASVTLPNNFTVDDKGVATAGDVKVQLIGSTDNSDVLSSFMATVAKKGSDSGYKDYKNGTIGEFTYHEFTANPKELKNLTTDRQTTSEGETWMEYPPDMILGMINDTSNVVKIREVDFINTKTNKITTLLVYTNNTDADLNSPEINNIVNSIAPLQK